MITPDLIINEITKELQQLHTDILNILYYEDTVLENDVTREVVNKLIFKRRELLNERDNILRGVI